MKLWGIVLLIGIIAFVIGAQSFSANLVVGRPGKEIFGLPIGLLLIISALFIRKMGK